MPKKRVVKILPDDHLPIEEDPGSEALKKLYAWTEEEAIVAFGKWIKEGHPPEKRNPIEKWMAAQELRLWHDHYKNGRKKAITEGLYLCTLNDLPIPRWLAVAYLGAYRKVYRFRAESWNDVLGRPHAKGIHLSAKREEIEKMFAVYSKIREIKKRNPERPIDEYLFEAVGKEYGLGRSLANKYYYQAKKRYKLLK